ncbi:MAG: HAD family phosphatase [Candidatus Pacearchaeota archaeon]|jgi:HAD superfamily hydrolase (TIGR01509 family)
MKRGFLKDGYKAIIFDLDGTLINSLPYHLMAFKDLLLERGLRLSEPKVKALFGRPSMEIFAELKKHYHFDEDIEDLREERRYHYFKFIGTKNIVFPGVVKTLKKLRLDYKIGLATGSSYVTYSHSTDKDFQSLFDFSSTINDVRRGKPDPEQLFLVAKKLRVKPSECIVVGDSVYDGIAASKAGMSYIGVTTGYTSANVLEKYKPIKIIKSISELIKLL